MCTCLVMRKFFSCTIDIARHSQMVGLSKDIAKVFDKELAKIKDVKITERNYENRRQSCPHLLRFNKAYLVGYFSLYKTKLVDPWVRQKRDQL